MVAPLFIADGYLLEGYIPRFYGGEEDVYFMSKFLSSDRLLNIETGQLKELKGLLQEKPKAKNVSEQSDKYKVFKLDETHIDEVVEIYNEVFKSYPFPIHNPDYIRQTMADNVQYYGATKNGKIAALASSEIDFKGLNAEMTDFATSHQHLGNNLSTLLLQKMENEMKAQGICTLYTIARLNSIPMNKTFLRAGYQYSGTLVKNTNIAGEIESMNILYKHL